ncbi:CAAX protease family protein [Actinophytocola xanthii]|uniref:CAAX protease family protein n=1 Tax=Actinophytocola xanthii TaxID=1912961 RepID=A0A1Q8CPU4_9PSEU|nr:CAAX protease family protein [Actinophytocola xanthii]
MGLAAQGWTRRRTTATLVALVLLVGSTTLVNLVLPGWAYPVCGLVVAGALVAVARWAGLRSRAIGFDRRLLGRAAVFGLVGLGVIGLAFGVALAVPGLRDLFRDGRVDTSTVGTLLWVTLVRIPIGTVLLEEVAFRGVLPALLGAGADRWRWRPVLLTAALFGLWHAFPSLALVENAAVGRAFAGVPLVVVSVLAMLGAAVAGVVLHWWRHTGGGLLSPMLVHLATNSGGVLVAWWVLTNT